MEQRAHGLGSLALRIFEGAGLIQDERPEVTPMLCRKISHTLNPSFDVTPSRYITAIVTEEAVCRPPYLESLKESLELAVAVSAGQRGPL